MFHPKFPSAQIHNCVIVRFHHKFAKKINFLKFSTNWAFTHLGKMFVAIGMLHSSVCGFILKIENLKDGDAKNWAHYFNIISLNLCQLICYVPIFLSKNMYFINKLGYFFVICSSNCAWHSTLF